VCPIEIYFYLVIRRYNGIVKMLQAMKVENMVKLKEEFDYKSLCRRMEAELDRLVAENERQAKARQDNDEELERTVEESRQLVMEAEIRLQTALDVCQKNS
jgi:kinesin family protein 5